jgi:DNA repair protein RadC
MKIPEIKISFKIDKNDKENFVKIKSVEDCYKNLKLLFNSDTIDWVEEAIVLCLNRQNVVVGYYKLSVGGICGTVMDPRVIFTVALNCGASAIIVAHNHPSGNLNPSEADDVITERIKKSGEMLDIPLIDHIIITEDGYYSYSKEGKL